MSASSFLPTRTAWAIATMACTSGEATSDGQSSMATEAPDSATTASPAVVGSPSGAVSAEGSAGSGPDAASPDAPSLGGAGAPGAPTAENPMQSAGGSSLGGSSMGGSPTGGSSLGGSSGGASGGGPIVGGSAGATPGTGGAPRAGSGGADLAGAGGEADAGSPALGMPTEMALPDLSAVRQEHSVVAVAGEVYVIGGYTPNVTASVVAYDPVDATWRDATDFPEPMNHGNAGVVDGKIYVAGYYVNGMTQATVDNYSYDPETEQWSPGAPLPLGTERGAGCVAVDSGFMYVFGGANDGMSVEFASRYDAAADEWQVLPPLPERREHCTAGAISGVLYVAGGRADTITGVQSATWAFDPEAMQWTEKASLSPPRGGLAGAVLGDRFFVFGGEGNAEVSSGVFPEVDAYDPLTDSWESMPLMDVPRHGFGAATLDGRIYLLGGATRQGGGADDKSSVFFFE